MSKTIVILGTLDTKGEHLYLLKTKDRGEGAQGAHPRHEHGIDSRRCPPNSPHAEIARLGGHRHGRAARGPRQVRLRRCDDRRGAAEGGRASVEDREIDGIVAMGGASMALIASRVMCELPFGIPKVIATPAAMPTYISEWFGAMDVVIMQVIMEFAGMHNLLDAVISPGGRRHFGHGGGGRRPASLKLPYPVDRHHPDRVQRRVCRGGKEAPRREGLTTSTRFTRTA